MKEIDNIDWILYCMYLCHIDTTNVKIEKRRQMAKPLREAIIGITISNHDNLISELENAKLIDNGNILVLTDSKDGVSSYVGYENFRIFCNQLVCKYLSK